MKRSIMVIVGVFLVSLTAIVLWPAAPAPTRQEPATAVDAPSATAAAPLVDPPGAAASSTSAATAERAFTRDEVAKHSTADDCWIIIHGVVYDVTAYIDLHPSPPEAILRYAGRDATVGWDTKDVGRPHSARAHRLLQRYRIGVLKE